MSLYVLQKAASADFFAILDNTAEHRGQDAADELGLDLTAGFRRLALTPGLGHLREDITNKPLYFYLVDEFYVVYLRGVDPLPILAIYHSSRDIEKLLRRR